jgi:hypothetical protein
MVGDHRGIVLPRSPKSFVAGKRSRPYAFGTAGPFRAADAPDPRRPRLLAHDLRLRHPRVRAGSKLVDSPLGLLRLPAGPSRRAPSGGHDDGAPSRVVSGRWRPPGALRAGFSDRRIQWPAPLPAARPNQSCHFKPGVPPAARAAPSDRGPSVHSRGGPCAPQDEPDPRRPRPLAHDLQSRYPRACARQQAGGRLLGLLRLPVGPIPTCARRLA